MNSNVHPHEQIFCPLAVARVYPYLSDAYSEGGKHQRYDLYINCNPDGHPSSYSRTICIAW